MYKKKHPIILTLNILIFFSALLFHYTDAFSISIKGLTPLLILPILTAFSLFNSPLSSALTGLAAGVFMDACSVGSYCFNAIVLMLIGVFVCLLSNNLFNKNIRSAAVLSVISCAFYFILQWLFFHTDNVSIKDNFIYLLKYALPSVLLSAIFIFPFYYLYKHFDKISSE